MWQELRSELHPQGLEIVTVALDTGGAEAARPWIEAAQPCLGYFTCPRQFNPADRLRGTPIVVMETTQYREGDNASRIHTFAVHRC